MKSAKSKRVYGVLAAIAISFGLSFATQLSATAQGHGRSELVAANKGDSNVAEIYKFHAKALDGKDIDMGSYKGDVMLIVNTASKCGFTPQYAGLEELHKKYHDRGLVVLGFPCNQFGQQEPGDHAAIGSFCQKNYGVEFQMFDKIDVNGKDAHPLYQYLTASNGGVQPIKWNFTKFLVDRQGHVVKRYESNVKPEDIAADIEKQL